VRKFPCPQCGADLIWNPAAKRLSCGYCGFVREVGASDDPAVRERPLDEELARPRDLGWGMERKSYRCVKCGASSRRARRASSCAFCGTPAWSKRCAHRLSRRRAPVPDHEAVRERFRDWPALWPGPPT
jgi:ribosomal protein S27AE